MNNLEEIQEFIRNFVYEKKETQRQIVEIEEKRTQLAQKRNEMKKSSGSNADVIKLGNQIAELGCKSQELQNKLDFSFKNVTLEVKLSIDNLISEGIRNIRKMQEEIFDLEEKIKYYDEKNAKFEIQKQEFYERFGRVPELSENAQQEIEIQERDISRSKQMLTEIQNRVEKRQDELVDLVQAKRDFKNKDWAKFEEIVTDVKIEELEPLEELHIEELQVEELNVEEFKPVEFEQQKERIVLKEFKVIGAKEATNEIEQLARAIVEEIAAEQTKEIIVFEKVEEQIKEEALEEKIVLSNIIAKMEDGEVVYKAQISNGKKIKVYPTKTNTGNLLLKYKEKREEFEGILINYASANNVSLDKKAIKKIDPIVCEILVEFANRYDYDVQKLIYNYAMSFSRYEEYDIDEIPKITYNLSYTTTLGTVLSRKEKATISKLCRDARKNEKIDMIGYVTKFNRIRYVLKRIFDTNKIKALSEGKY